ncbi:leucine efflux protein LeuE [Neisseriaceae bacterium ESL0693]|nr:leucine efflux protein LeuE [Neisseriaceae bacterium ESL0693]
MILGITNLGTYVLGAAGIILVPGPNSIYCLTVAARHGIKPAYCALAGILVGDSTLMLLSALGAASILQTMPLLFNVIKLIGGAYLVYLGWRLCRDAYITWQSAGVSSAFKLQPAGEQSFRPPEISAGHVFRHACLLSLSNPKGILFFLAFFVQFINPQYAHPMISFLLLALILLILSSSYLSVLIWGGRMLVGWFGRYRRIAAVAMAAIGLLFMSFAATLWVAVVS